MEANELRIGNYVMFNQEQFTNNKNHQEVELICNDGVVLKTFSYPYQEIQPIPLTEEWLVKFGFGVHHDINYNEYKILLNYKSGFTDTLVVIDKGGDLNNPIYLYSLKSNTDKSYMFLKTYDYVHQLQNLYFALTNKELKIK